MIKYIYTFLLLIGAVLQLSAQEKPATPAAPKTKQPLTYEAFFKKDMRKIGDVLPVYTDGKKYYLEIREELLNADLLAGGMIIKGPWKGSASDITDLFRFNLGRNNTLEVKRDIFTDRIDSLQADSGLVAALEMSSMQPVKFTYPIYAWGQGKKGYIIDISSDINSAGKLFSFPGLQWVNRPDALRSTTDSIYSIDNGVKFIVTHSQTDYMPGGFGMPGYDKHNTVNIEWTLQSLPQREMQQRLADPRVGYATLSFNDYSKDPTSVKRNTIIRRWRLEVKPEDVERYKRGELVEPASPIYVHIDETFPDTYREKVIEAVREWDAAFASAGFKNVLRVEKELADASFGYGRINCTLGPTMPKNHSVSDPRTGEILCGCIQVSTLDLDKNAINCAIALGAFEPRILTGEMSELRPELCRQQISVQLGTILGLQPNRGGSLAYTTAQLRDGKWIKENGISASIMDDCVVNFVVQPGDKVDFTDLFGHVSHYDRWAIGWGYRVFPDNETPEQDKESLQEMLAKAKNNPLLTYIQPNSGYASASRDLASDKLEAARLGILNIQTLTANLEKITAPLKPEEDMWASYWELARETVMQYGQYVSTVLPYIGDIRKEAVIPGFNNNPWAYVPREQQAEAMKFISQYVLRGVPEWMQNTPMRQLAGYDGEETMTMLLARVSNYLNNPGVINGLLETERQLGKKAYTADEMCRAIDQGIFLSYDASRPVNRFNRRAQFIYAQSFIDFYKKVEVEKNVGDLPSFMVSRMKSILKSVDRLSREHSDPASRQHYRGLYVNMQHLLDKEGSKEKAPENENKTALQAGIE